MNNDNKYYATIATNGNTMCSSFFSLSNNTLFNLID